MLTLGVTGLFLNLRVLFMTAIFVHETITKGSEEFNLAGPFGNLYGIINHCQNPASPKVLVISHGFRGSLEGGGRATRLAAQAAAFCTVVRFNFSDCQLLSKQVAELECVLKFVQTKLKPQKLFLLGRSLGGATAITVASKNRSINGLILWSTPHNLVHTFRNVLGAENYAKLLAGQSLSLTDERGPVFVQAAFVQEIAQWHLAEYLKKWPAKPILIVHGSADMVVAPAEAQANYDTVSQPKKLVYIKDGDHSFMEHGDEANGEVLTWLKKWL
jgi:pimeloyl-ACP methyl ester carboxylesterase